MHADKIRRTLIYAAQLVVEQDNRSDLRCDNDFCCDFSGHPDNNVKDCTLCLSDCLNGGLQLYLTPDLLMGGTQLQQFQARWMHIVDEHCGARYDTTKVCAL